MQPYVLDHFKQNDPTLFSVIQKEYFINLKISNNLFSDLCEAIVSQQLSVKAADTIFLRFHSLFPNQIITPEHTIELSSAQIRETGISLSKVGYIKNIAEATVNGQLPLEKIHTYDNNTIIETLTQIKGIGIWTAEMFLMSSLGREDVFSFGDLGLRKAIQKLYKLDEPLTKEKAEEIARKWSPYKTYACKILWRYLQM